MPSLQRRPAATDEKHGHPGNLSRLGFATLNPIWNTGALFYKKVKRKKIAASLRGTPFGPNGSQDHSINLLCSLRDQFVHFLLMSWSIEVAGLPQMCRDVCDFIEFLTTDYRTILWREVEHPARVKIALEKVCRVLACGSEHDE